ncbi:hypothetical protein [Malacoplasma penetrans HF-2]|uniref:Uncharacterized protein n=1 Tax=Malacoplasma penetrans (strain HF-2) TaxID=272633 RepID=Q8EW23_MALP2|nr:hypothetical protein [Malacoplasma penetrans]BAC44173.1 hypothetical protein [Malacoplasma penetrans HF-2]
MKPKNKIKKVTKFLSLKKAVLFSGVTSLVVVPSSITFTLVELSRKTYSFQNKSFTSQNSLLNYVKNNSTKIANKTEGNNSSWQVTYNGQTKKFSSPESLRSYVDTLISNKGAYVTNSASYVKNQNVKSLDNIDWKQTYALNSSEEARTLTQTIYQGLNDKSFDNIDDAINSFFNNDLIKRGYYFNGTYFQNKSDLKDYLTSNYLPTNGSNSYKTIVLKGPNGSNSTAISLNDPASATASIRQFIENNSTATIKYTNSRTGQTVKIDENNINQAMNSVDNGDLSYVSMKSNEGESRYILDNSDSSNLIGPYLYNGVLDIGSFTNKSMWKKVNGISKSVYAESKINTMIGSFFSTVIVDDRALSLSEYEQDPTKDIPIFRTSLLVADGKNSFWYDENGNKMEGELSLDDWFLKQLGILSPALKQEAMNVNLQLLSGNKYNTFYKIPVMYSFLMQRVVQYGLSQEAIDLIVYYFTEVCNYIQDAIELMILNSSLLVNGDGVKFNLASFFNIGNMDYDLNTNVEYFLEKIKEWPKMIAAMDAYMGAYNNLLTTSGLIPFTSYDQSYLVENGIITNAELDSISNSLLNIYLAFSQTNYVDFLGAFVPVSDNKDIQEIYKNSEPKDWEKKIDETAANNSNSSIGVILKSAVQQNNQHQILARTVLLNEIRIYKASGYILPSGYLSLLWSKRASANKIDQYVDFVSANETLDAYKVYLAFIVDMRMKTDLINDSSLSSADNFAKTLTRVIWLTLSTSVMVTSTLKNLYNTGSKFFSSSSGSSSAGSFSDSSSTGTITQSLVDRLEELRDIPQPQTSQLWDAIGSGTVRSTGSSDSWETISERFSLGTSKTAGSGTRTTGSSQGEVIYIKPEDLFVKVAHSGTLTSEGKIEYSFSNKYEQLTKVSSIIPNPKDFQRQNTIYAQLANTTKSATSSNTIVTAKGQNGSIFHASNLNKGLSISEGNLSLILPLDEVKIQNTSTSIANEVTIRNKKGNRNANRFSGLRISYINTNSGFLEINASTTFTSKFKNKLSLTKLYNFGNKALESAKKFAQTVKKLILPIISVAFSALETYFFILDLINVDYKQDFYVYTASDGTEFIWDGGLTVSKFLGFVTYEETNIDSMKLVNPIQISLPQVEEYYYYNGRKYYDINDLKRTQLLYIIRNKYNGAYDKFTLNYSLNNNEGEYSNLTTVDQLFEHVMTSIGATKKDDGSYDFSGLKNDTSYVASISSGFKGTENMTATDYGNIAQVIVDSIRPTNIVQLPEVGENGKTTGKISTFVYPGKYYDSTTKKIVEGPSNSSNYIIDDTANAKDSSSGAYTITDESKAVKESKDKLEKSFKDKLKDIINSKEVLKNDYLFSDAKFSSLSSNINVVNLYQVNLNNQTNYFNSINEARSFLLEKLNFAKNEDVKISYSYIYNNKYFANEDELSKWVLANTITK